MSQNNNLPELNDWTKDLFGLRFLVCVDLGETDRLKESISKDIEKLFSKSCPNSKLLERTIIKKTGIVEMLLFETDIDLFKIHQTIPIKISAGEVINLTQQHDHYKNFQVFWNPKLKLFRF